MKGRKLVALLVVMAMMLSLFAACGSPTEEAATETKDGGGKFLPIPIIITEPAIGEGIGAGLVYFHADHSSATSRLTGRARPLRTSSRMRACTRKSRCWLASLSERAALSRAISRSSSSRSCAAARR